MCVSQAVLEEADALLYMRNGISHCEARPNQDKVLQLLRDDRDAMSSCGECEGCRRGVECVHVANIRAAVKGKQGAMWASQGPGLVGKTFEVPLIFHIHACHDAIQL